MHLIDTKVVHQENMLVVDFIGEGGEVISVRLDEGDGQLDDATAIDHAKVMMVQLTAFDTHERPAINAYDALSNGNLDARVDPLAITDAPSDLTTH